MGNQPDPEWLGKKRRSAGTAGTLPAMLQMRRPDRIERPEVQTSYGHAVVQAFSGAPASSRHFSRSNA
jgi:hypothetical protein